MIAMINSAALPKVALSSPPIPSPSRSASCSVARPIRPASGMIASAAVAKIARPLACIAYSSTSAIGTKTSSAIRKFCFSQVIASGQVAVVKRGRIAFVLVTMREIIFGPNFEWGKGQPPLELLHDRHGQLEAVARAKIDVAAVEHLFDDMAKHIRLDQRDQVRDLIGAVGIVQLLHPLH